MKMEPIKGSETSAIRNQTPGNYPKENIIHTFVFALKHSMKAQRYSCTFSLTLALGYDEWLSPRFGRFTPWRKRPGTRFVEACVWMDKERKAPTGNRTTDFADRSKSLYQ
jgi:hypothetical protein